MTELEKRYANFLGTTADKIVLVANATAGITASIQSLGGGDWLVPSWTFSATVAGALAANVNVQFGDINPQTQWLLEPPQSTKIEGIVKVAPFGTGFRDEEYMPRFNLVIDAAASIAAPMPNLNNLPETNVVVFSLHATKVLGIGEGGLVACGSRELADEIRRRTNFGFDDSRHSNVLGTNAKMSEFSAAIGHIVMDNWEAEKSKWLEARELTLAAAASAGIRTFNPSERAINPYWVVMFNSEDERDQVERALGQQNIQTRRWWANGAHTMTAYRHLPSAPLTATEDISSRYLGLPFFRGITQSQVGKIVGEIEKIVGSSA